MKQVLLIGDSIREGYCEQVKELLKNDYEVIYPPVNCRSSQAIIISLHNWVTITRPEDVEFVHFNCGQWDTGRFYNDKYPLTEPKEYKRNLGMIIRILNKLFPNAQVIIATTTPMNPDDKEALDKALVEPNPALILHPRTTKDVIKYNKIVKNVAKEYNVTVNDLYKTVNKFDGSYFIDCAHLTKDGYDILAKKIVKLIKKLRR